MGSALSIARIPPGGIALFDAVGTLLHPEPAVAEAYERVGREFGSRLTRPEIDARFRAVFTAEKNADLRDNAGRTDEPRERERWRAIVGAVFDDVPQARHDALFESLWRHFALTENWRTFDDVGPTLKRLAAAGHSLAIASNFDSRLVPIAAALVPEIPRERVFVSSLVGYRKPAGDFFRACERLLIEQDVATGSLTLIGDDVDEDFHGAAAAGWNAILLDRDGRHANAIRSLSEL